MSRFSGLCGTMAVTALAGCVSPAPAPSQRATVPLAVTNNGQPFAMWDGAAARKVADAECGPRGVNVSIYDRYDRATGAWVYPKGCA